MASLKEDTVILKGTPAKQSLELTVTQEGSAQSSFVRVCICEHMDVWLCRCEHMGCTYMYLWIYAWRSEVDAECLPQ